MSSADTPEARPTARLIGKLTTVSVRQARLRGLYGDGGGLFLQVSPNGAKSWVFRFKKDGRLRVMGLGPVHTISLAEARDRARECRKLRLDGIDPIEERHRRQLAARFEAAKAITFRQCAKAYIETHQASWKNPKHAAQWPSTLETYVYPVFGDLSVQAVDTERVLKAIEPIWTVVPETASRVRGRIETVLDWAKARGYRSEENPARWRGHLDQLLPKKSRVAQLARRARGKGEHFAAMPYRDLPAFVVELRERRGVAARALEFTILTAKRTEEVISARWPEISAEEKLWTIPAGRMKGEREHRVPLSDAALTVLEAMQPIKEDPAGFIFPGGRRGRGLSNMAMLNLLQKRIGRPHVTVHGFRSSFRDWTAERTSFSSEVAEMALAHVVDDKVEAAYRRGDLLEKRHQLAEAWARYCDSPVPSAQIVPIRGKVAIE
jgi:integrase